ncbi:MAG: YlbF family regulator [Longimicrobiales bacterium]
MDATWEKAKELGRLLGQTEEYKALQRAKERVSNERSMVTLLNRLGELEGEIARALQHGQEPPQAIAEEYERIFADVQGRAEYQGIVAAQSNFDKVLARVNDEISKGMTTASQSRLILPT